MLRIREDGDFVTDPHRSVFNDGQANTRSLAERFSRTVNIEDFRIHLGHTLFTSRFQNAGESLLFGRCYCSSVENIGK